MIRFFDIIISILGLCILFPVLLCILLWGYADTGNPIFLQKRVGVDKKPFTLIKFRTMISTTSSVATHLVDSRSVTKFGCFLRASKLDELPQLINVIKGEMSLVGPRPCLLNQVEVIYQREKRGAFHVRPGITGLAQISNVDMSVPLRLARIDKIMIQSLTLRNYFFYIYKTALGKGQGDNLRGSN